MVPKNNKTEVTPWIRNKVSSPASVLLLASDDAPTAGNACQNLITTASERSEHVLALEYGKKQTWLDRLHYEPANLRRARTNEGESIPIYIEEFLDKYGEEKNNIIYLDSLSALASDIGVDNTAAVFADIIHMIETPNTIGFFRADPELVEIDSLERLVNYTAKYKPSKQKWEVSPRSLEP